LASNSIFTSSRVAFSAFSRVAYSAFSISSSVKLSFSLV
jgi:hypothetical protein